MSQNVQYHYGSFKEGYAIQYILSYHNNCVM